MTDQPNFLFIITDQHRADYLGSYGHKVVESPNIDSLAARGRAFDRFYVANPVCQPNRATLMTGRMPSVHGVRHNGINLSVNSVTFLNLMHQAGYRTALLGKSHLQNMSGGDPRMFFPDPKVGETPPPPEMREAHYADAPEELYEQEHPKNWEPDSDYKISVPFYGFDQVALTTGHGDRVGGAYNKWLEERHPGSEKLRGPENALPHNYTCPQAWRTAVPEELHSNAYVRDVTNEYLQQHVNEHSGVPFFAMASFSDPHHPFSPPGKYWDMFDPDDMELPPSFYSNEPKPPSVEWQYKRRDDGSQVTQGQELFALNERQAKEAVALTCGAIKFIDDCLGDIFATLDELGLADNTIVIFTSDHGDLMADHQLILKGPIHYHGLIRVPFIWSDLPGIAKPGRSDAMCGTLDIAQTILDRVRLQPFNGMQGRSILPEISGAADQGLGCVFIEADDQRPYFDVTPPARCRTLVTRTHRMSIYHGVEWGELYDLENDPNEIHNLFDDPVHAELQSNMFRLMAYRQLDLVDRSPLPTKTA